MNFFCLFLGGMKKMFFLCFMNDTQTHIMTLGNLPFGTTVLYNDQANTDLRLTIVGHEQDQFGKWVEVLTENGSIEPMKAHTKIDGNRYTLA